MCGIVAIVSNRAIERAPLRAMTEALAHRGPDGFGYHEASGFAFGHRRLAILDLSERGHQPMFYQDRYVITYNGEIYNYRELRAELEAAGFTFATHTDTEVVLAAYAHWGTDCLKRFNGMWAFVLKDLQTGLFFIARDRFGVKPLYHMFVAGQLVFASEIKALLRHPEYRAEANLDYCRAYLRGGPREYGRETAFRGVESFAKGAYVEATQAELLRGDFSVRRFWSLEPRVEAGAVDENQLREYAQRYYSLLEDAVALRLRSDVKVGSALSGGLDSSSVVHLVNKQLKERGASESLQETFSSVYGSPGTEHCDETVHIDKLEEYLRVHSNRIEPDPRDVPAEHERMIYYMDTPPESSLMSSWHTFRLVASTDVVVTLDGQGADEQLAGYPRYAINAIAYSNSPLKDSRALRKIPGFGPFASLGLSAAVLRRLGLGRLLPSMLKRAGKQVFDGERLNEALVKDSLNGLQNLIHYADRTSMAFSIESRMPFLDYRLAEFLAAMPACYKLHDGWTKYVARKAMDGHLPDSITWRRDKMGWGIPEAFWFRGELQPWLSAQVSGSDFLAELDARPRPGALYSGRRSMTQVLRLLNLAAWHRVHIEDGWRPEALLRQGGAGFAA